MKYIYPSDVSPDEVYDSFKWLSISLSTTPLEIYVNDTLLGTATGFFFYEQKRVYLVTCRHCIYDERYYPDKIIVRLHTDLKNLTKNVNKKINIYIDNTRKKWISSDKYDLALIKMDWDVLDGCYLSCFTKEDILSPSNVQLSKLAYELEIGSRLLILGYPQNIYDRLNNLPISMNASLGSTFPVWFNGEPYFVVSSCNLPKGMSGSPVLTADSYFRETITFANPHYLLGIFVGPILSSGFSNSTLYAVHYADLILDVLRECESKKAKKDHTNISSQKIVEHTTIKLYKDKFV
jgi:hypothetical protein